ncbi:MAG TPA: energy transducer TonB [Terriglobales bacterium]
MADTNPSAEQMLATAEKQADLCGADASSFRLEMDFVAQNMVPMTGHLTLKWAAKDRWWRSITMGVFRETDIRSGEKLYISRNLGYTPTRVKELESLIQISQDAARLQIKKVKQRKENGASLTCLQVHGKESKTKNELCIDPGSNDLLWDDWKVPPDESMREEYSDYREFHGHRYPTKLARYTDGSKVVNAGIVDLEVAPLDPALLVPPAGAIERRQCEGMKHPIPLHTPDPSYPESARDNRMMGETTVAVTVLTDGSVENIQLVGSAGRSLDEATLNTLKSWKFKPAMCGTEPVVTDVEVEVDFRLTR